MEKRQGTRITVDLSEEDYNILSSFGGKKAELIRRLIRIFNSLRKGEYKLVSSDGKEVPVRLLFM